VMLAFLVFAVAVSACNTAIIAGDMSIIVNGQTQTTYVAQSGGVWGGVSPSGNALSIKHDTRAYLTSDCIDSFSPSMFTTIPLLDKTLSFDVSLASISCGCNVALYLVSMPAYNSSNQADPTKCGDYYCDANQVCGIYCPEIDIMEANNRAFAITPHKCDNPQGNYYPSCDGGGCNQNVYRLNPSNYGPGSNYLIDTTQWFHVAIQFQSSGGQLSQIVTTLAQGSNNVQVVHNSGNCGGNYLQQLTQAVQKGMVVTFSYWGSDAGTMSWLDIPPCDYSQNCDPNQSVTFSNIQIN